MNRKFSKSENRIDDKIHAFEFTWHSLDMFALVLVIAIFAFSATRSLHEYRWSYWASGDAQMLNAGIHFRDEGFLVHNFLPLVNPGYIHDLIPNNWPNGRYTHYPSLHAIIIGVLGKIFFDPLIPSRIAAVFFGSLSVLFWYFFVRMIFGRGVALMSAFFIGFSTINLDFIDALCGQPYDEFFRFASMFLFLALESDTEETQKKRYLLIPVIWILMLLESLNSVEYVVYLWVFTAGYYLFNKKLKDSLGKIFLFSLAPVAGFTFHFVQTVWEYGNISGVISDWGNTLLNRATSQAAGVHVGGTGSYLKSLENLFMYLINHFWSQYKMAILACVLFFIYFSFGKFNQLSKSLYDKRIKIWILLFLSGSSFYFLLPVQSYNMRDYIFKDIFPSISIIFAVSSVFFITKLHTAARSSSRTFGRLFVLFFSLTGILLILHPFVETVKYVSRYPNLLGGPRWGMSNKTTADEWIDRIKQAKLIQENTFPGDIILVPQGFRDNSGLGVTIEEYYAQRHLILMGSNPGELITRIQRLHDYKKDFMKKEPKLQDSKIWVFIDKQRVPKSLLYYLMKSFNYTKIDSDNDRFMLAKIENHLPPPTLRPLEIIFSEARAIWKLDDSLETVTDAKGKYDAETYNTKIVEGKINKGRWLNGINSYIKTPLIFKDWTTFSIAFWVKPEHRPSNEVAIILDNGSNEKENFVIQSNGISETSFSWLYGTNAPFELPLNLWTHVVVTADILNNQIKVYLNGENRVTLEMPPFSKPGAIPLTFGKWATAQARYFKGSLDEIGVWDYVLEDEDVKNMYNSSIGKPLVRPVRLKKVGH